MVFNKKCRVAPNFFTIYIYTEREREKQTDRQVGREVYTRID